MVEQTYQVLVFHAFFPPHGGVAAAGATERVHLALDAESIDGTFEITLLFASSTYEGGFVGDLTINQCLQIE